MYNANEKPESLAIFDIFSLKCSGSGPSFCQQCESCKLIDKVVCTKAWFTPLGFKSQKSILETFILSVPEFMKRLPGILIALESKDYQYTKCRLKPAVNSDGFQSNTNHSLNEEVNATFKSDLLSWFVASSEWSRSNYILSLLQLCSTQLIDSIKQYVSRCITGGIHVDDDKFSRRDINEQESYEPKSARKFVPKCKSAPVSRLKYGVESCIAKNRDGLCSARERVLFDDEIKLFNYADNFHDKIDESCVSIGNSKISFDLSCKLNKNPSRVQFCPKSSSSARCTPLRLNSSQYSPIEDNNTSSAESNLLLNTERYKLRSRKDLIRYLPIHLAKKIFGYLNENGLKIVSCVSKLWNDFANQVKADVKYIQARKEDVMMMQSTGCKNPHPCYARYAPVFIPKADKRGIVKVNKEAKYVDVEIMHDEFADINLENCFDGFETQKVMMEERNVYCSSYNVFVLQSHQIPNRHINYNSGNYVAVGSSDRKIHILNVNSGELIKTISGHSGSVKCLHLDESNQYIISGSYDTSIRLSNLSTGRCKYIFIGHKGTIVCLAVSSNILVSAAIDGTIRVWDLLTGKCKKTFSHTDVIRAASIQGNQVITGSSSGFIICWDLQKSSMVKNFKGHDATINCIKCNFYHIFSGSSDGLVKLWNNVGNLNTSLRTFKHPGEVLCIDFSYLRLITGCCDGKIRIWNILNGNCLRVIRGNSKNDPISYIFASEYRLVVNTTSSILVYNFEKVQWDHCAQREQQETIQNTIHNSSDGGYPYSYTRAQKLLYRGSPLHKTAAKHSIKQPIIDYGNIPISQSYFQVSKTQLHGKKESMLDIRNNDKKESMLDIRNNDISTECKNNQTKCASRLSSSIDHHVSRMKSATINKIDSNFVNLSGDEYVKRGESVSEVLNTQFPQYNGTQNEQKSSGYELKKTGLPVKSHRIKDILDDVSRYKKRNNSKLQIKTRCRSAPVQRLITLPPNERGVTTSSFTFAPCKSKMLLKAPKIKDQRPKTAIPSYSVKLVTDLQNLNLRTFHSQDKFEKLRGKSALHNRNRLSVN